jgi:predicted TIM-barrel fold metal-dependent hydrolase
MNIVYAEMFRGIAGRVMIAASIPMHTPTAAIEELDYAVNTLGFKSARMNGYAVRPLPRVHREHPELFMFANHFDTFGLDSEYDYDPFWARCVELGIAPVTHSSLLNRPTRSVSNYVYNHIGGLAHAHEALCKSLFLGGVTRRFPDLNVGFLEAGVGWACVLLADLVGHWEKRNVDALRANLDPARLDVDLLVELIDRYGDPGMQQRVELIRAWLAEPEPVPAELDDFVACAIDDVADIIELFVPHFYFGCEGDDPGVSWAFNASTNPSGARLRAMFGSDISHWDVPDMTEPMAEAYEQVEDGRLAREDFRDFVFTNAVRLYTKTNPNFFDGTPCETAAREVLETPT